MPAMNSTRMRKLFKDSSENIYKLLALLLGIITATDSAFMKQHKQMMFLVLTIVVYSFLVMSGTIAEIYKRRLLPFIICAMLIVAAAASFLALTIISFTLAIITLVLWLGIFALFVLLYVVVPQRSIAPLPNPVFD